MISRIKATKPLKMNVRGYMRIVEVIITLVLLFTYTALVVSRNPPIPQSVKNTRVLTRHAVDLKNMVCNSDQDRKTITKGNPLGNINSSLFAVTPPDLAYQLVVMDPVTEAVTASTGFELPDLSDPGESTDVATASCIISTVWGTDKAVLQTWYK
jgi:hypothetical protein